jgi:hypothetical protein
MVKIFGLYAIIAFIILSPLSLLAQDALECYPPCRSGFVCYKGKCISKCNPPCPDGQKCTDSGECTSFSQSESNADKQNKPVEANKQTKDIECVKVFIVRPQMGPSNVPGSFEESELISASNMIANAIVKKIAPSSAIIAFEDMGAVQNCNSKMIIAKVKSYYKEPARLGQFQGNVTISISRYDSLQQKSPTKKQEFTAKGDRSWGDSVPLQNAIQEVCEEIKRKYKP